MNHYRHTQYGRLIITVIAAVCLLQLIIGLTVTKYVLVALPILAAAGWLFHSLTIEITGSELHWRFGPGLIRKHVPLGEITAAEPVRTNFLEGWGIHWSRFGWLYNVSGYDAVAITLRGGKRFALGTDQPHELTRALQPAANPGNPTQSPGNF